MNSSWSFRVLYGSQTGNAQDIGERLWQDAKRRHFHCEISPMDDYDVKNLPNETLVVCVCSTTGQGEEPDNMKIFWKFLLRRSLPKDSLSNVHFGVLGLGDSSYQRFNFAAKKLFRRLEQLGGKPIIPLGLADDQHDLGYDGVAETWIKNFWDKIKILFPFSNEISDDEILPPKFRIVWTENETESFLNVGANDSLEWSKDNPFFAPLLACDRVTATDHFQDTRLVRLDIQNSLIRYSPGDVAMVQPSNLAESVEKIIELLGFDKQIVDAKFFLEPNDQGTKLPPLWLVGAPTTLRECFEHCFDLHCTPRRSFFRLLSYFAANELEKEKLIEFCTPENQEDLFSYCNRPRRTVLEALEDFHHTARRIPVDYLFDIFSPIRPRAFSIASSQSVCSQEIQLLVAVVSYKTGLSRPRQGLCSTWLSRQRVGSKIPIWTRRGTFKFPKNRNPCILVGPGTGIAPFRSFLQDVSSRGQSAEKHLLFFGCRNRHKDFYFEKEWKILEDSGIVVLYSAFSRDQDQKVYVQHRMEEVGGIIWHWLTDFQAYVFVAGNANQMPKDVIQSLKTISNKLGGLSDSEADSFVTELEKGQRLQLETWS